MSFSNSTINYHMRTIVLNAQNKGWNDGSINVCKNVLEYLDTLESGTNNDTAISALKIALQDAIENHKKANDDIYDGLENMYKELPGNVSVGSYDYEVSEERSWGERFLLAPFTFGLSLFD